ncbi:MAG: GTPase ObgE, partial [Proteobacteria bacterium]|nr:GTPase ObgE [Pseudomonadota bacterium]
FQPILRAPSGKKGEGSRREGKSGADLRIPLPLGTQIFAHGSTELVADLTEDGQEVVICKGGRGGKGNDFFKSPTNRAPDYAQPGEPGQEGSFLISLKLVADVGIIGFPNAGKSTLISRISAARPKIADYPFTTLTPNLGVVQAKGGRNYVVADVPGLIPGAHAGKGLGLRFLKHIERTSLLAHLIDVTQMDEQGQPVSPVTAFQQICAELAAFSPELASRKQVVALSKIDASTDRDELRRAADEIRALGNEVLLISSATGEGIDALIECLAGHVAPRR